MTSYNDEVAKIYVNMAKDAATKNAEELTAAANKATAVANTKGSRANHIKAERAHQDAARAWRALPDGAQRASVHEIQANNHFQRAQ